MRAEAASAAALSDEVSGAHNVLVLASPLDDADGSACSSLLSGVDPANADVVCVTFNQPPDARIEHWQATDGPVDPANLGFVVVGDGLRSANAAVTGPEEPASDGLGPTVVSVTSPADLTGLGIELGSFFSDWADDGNRLLLCFHTLTTFLQYAELRTAYRFIHVLTGRVQTADGLAHYHLDPAAHDESTVNTLLALFDAVVEHDELDHWDVRRRR